MDNRKIGIAIPTYNRPDVTIEAFRNVVYDDRVSEITIVDDCSPEDFIWNLQSNAKNFNKVSVYVNPFNIDCFRNKKTSIFNSVSDWVILFDSDNILSPLYIDRLFAIEKWEPNTIYTPFFAEPHFDFRAYSGLTITKENVAEYIDKPMFETMLNACNYFVNRNEYLRVWDGSVDPVTSDSVYVCLRWLEAGNKIQVVDGLQYYHRVWTESHYQKNVNRTPVGFHQEVLNKLRQLK